MYYKKILFPIILCATNSLAMQEQKIKHAEAAQQIPTRTLQTVTVKAGDQLRLAYVYSDGSPGPKANAYTQHLEKTHAQSILDNCPKEISTIVNMLKRGIEINDWAFPKNLLLTGPTGVGKTVTGQAIATELNMPFFQYCAASIPSEFLDSGKTNLNAIFADAAALNKPCVVIIDEFQALINWHKYRCISEPEMLLHLLNLLESYKNHPILFVATIRNDEEIPAFVKKAFENGIINMPLPNEQQREKIITYLMKCRESETFSYASEVSAKILAEKTFGYDHRSLNLLIIETSRTAALRSSDQNAPIIVCMQDCLESLKKSSKKSTFSSNATSHKKTIKKLTKILGAGICAIGAIYIIYAKQKARKKKEARKMPPYQNISRKLSFLPIKN